MSLTWKINVCRSCGWASNLDDNYCAICLETMDPIEVVPAPAPDLEPVKGDPDA